MKSLGRAVMVAFWTAYAAVVIVIALTPLILDRYWINVFC